MSAEQGVGPSEQGEQNQSSSQALRELSREIKSGSIGARRIRRVVRGLGQLEGTHLSPVLDCLVKKWPAMALADKAHLAIAALKIPSLAGPDIYEIHRALVLNDITPGQEYEPLRRLEYTSGGRQAALEFAYRSCVHPGAGPPTWGRVLRMGRVFSPAFSARCHLMLARHEPSRAHPTSLKWLQSYCLFESEATASVSRERARLLGYISPHIELAALIGIVDAHLRYLSSERMEEWLDRVTRDYMQVRPDFVHELLVHRSPVVRQAAIVAIDQKGAAVQDENCRTSNRGSEVRNHRSSSPIGSESTGRVSTRTV